MERIEVYKLIDGERDYQDTRWNATSTTSKNVHSVEEWYLYIGDYVEEAKHILCREARQTADPKAMAIMRKVAALVVSAIEQHGAPPR